MTDIDFDLALADAAEPSLAPRPVPRWAPDPYDWQQVLADVGQAVPLPRACALQGLDPKRVKAWLQANEKAQEQYRQARAKMTAALVRTVWNAATGPDPSFKAALSLLKMADPLFNQAPAKKPQGSQPVHIHAATAQVLSVADTGKLREMIGLEDS